MKKSILFCLIGSSMLFAQTPNSSANDELDQMLSVNKSPEYETATFKATQVIFSNTVEQSQKNNLQVLISHRFGPMISSGYEGFYGVDNANIRLAADYGITDWLNVGYARNNDGFKPIEFDTKIRLLRQRKDIFQPLTISFSNQNYWSTSSDRGLDFKLTPARRFNSLNTFLFASKITPNLSMQLTSGVLYRGITPSSKDLNWAPIEGLAWRYKFTSRVAWTGDILGSFPGVTVARRHIPAVGTGIDIETGGHVFQMYLTTSPFISTYKAASESILEHEGDPDLHFGFNISRSFAF